ncbi:MAG: hypothetical protein QM831_22985 [Kofleriaceae bacterium]
MRFDEKDLDGPELLIEQGVQENELVEEDEHDLGDVKLDEVLSEERESLVMITMREILEGRHVVINDLALPQRELLALEALKTAVEGKDGKLSQFVFADDRRDLLEQALAVLQPLLMHDVTAEFQDLVERIGNLRTGLKDLEDAQDELLEANREVGVVGSEGDTADKPKPKPVDDDMTLTGPERKLPAWKMTLDQGPEVADLQTAPTTLAGKDLPEKKPEPSQLERGGPDAPPLTEQPTTLGSKQDLAEAEVVEPQRLVAKTAPWWKPPRA